MSAPRPAARERRHTLYFLDEIRAAAPVFLDTEVDMTRVRTARAAARADGRRYGVVGYVLHAAARALADHPEANAAIAGHLRPRVVRFPTVTGKLALDKTVAGQRVVLSALLPDLDRADLAQIQERIDHFRDGDPDTLPDFAGVRMLHRLPVPLGRFLFRRAVRPLRGRGERMGSLAVSSLGHRPVDGFYSLGGTTITLGVGRIAERAVVRDGQLAAAPVMRLSLVFDHRVIDGAEAADLLADIKTRLEQFDAAAAAPEPGAAAAGRPEPAGTGPSPRDMRSTAS